MLSLSLSLSLSLPLSLSLSSLLYFEVCACSRTCPLTWPYITNSLGVSSFLLLFLSPRLGRGSLFSRGPRCCPSKAIFLPRIENRERPKSRKHGTCRTILSSLSFGTQRRIKLARKVGERRGDEELPSLKVRPRPIEVPREDHLMTNSSKPKVSPPPKKLSSSSERWPLILSP